MAIQQELWVRDIAENIFPDSSALILSRDDSEFLEGKTIHLPQSGSKPNVEKNRTTLPAVAAKRTDTELTYPIDEFTTDPVILQDTEAIEVSYNKRASVLFDHVETIREEISDNIYYYWGAEAATNIIRTTGAARAAFKTGQTGNRKAVTKNDFIEAHRVMNRQDVPNAGRVALVDADLLSDILKIDEFVSADRFGSAALPTGSVGMILGFAIFVRSKTTLYDNAATPVRKAVGAAIAAADNATIQFWHPSYVRRVVGSDTNGGIKVYEKNQDPQFYGDVFSAMVRAGGRKHRTDEKGVVCLVEDAAA